MIESLLTGDYLFIDLVQESKEEGVLYYDPCGWPFGGTEAIAALIESFGHSVTFDSYHEGPHPGLFHSFLNAVRLLVV